MIKNPAFRKTCPRFCGLDGRFFENIEELPVKSKAKPGEISSQLPVNPPDESESMDTIFNDFRSIILPGMTHWQSPNFFAYFPANSSYPSLLAEMLTATLGAQCMVWGNFACRRRTGRGGAGLVKNHDRHSWIFLWGNSGHGFHSHPGGFTDGKRTGE
ncbi:MAG: pyridoxal-dependent decarboxylase [Bacteroidales bacterium]